MSTRKQKPNVVLDVDGILLDFESAWGNCATETLGRPIPVRSCHAHLSSRFHLTKIETTLVWQAFHKEGWWGRIEPYPYAWDLVEALQILGCNVWAVTNVDTRFFRERAFTLDGLVDKKRIRMLGAAAHPEVRVNVMRELSARAFLDDLPQNANAAAFYVPASTYLYRGYIGVEPAGDGVTVIDDALDFPLLLERML